MWGSWARRNWIASRTSTPPLWALTQKPKVRLPGAGGAPEISSSAKEVLIIVKHSKRTLVEKLDFITSVGFLTGGDAREKAGLPGKGPVAVITDLCILRPHPQSRELEVASMHPGVDRATIAAEYRVGDSILRGVRRDRSSASR